MTAEISFTPRYHEQVDKPTGPVWVPMYNPARDCVAAEREQIEAEGGQVDSKAWKMPRSVRIQRTKTLAGAVDAVVIYLLLGVFIGEGLTRILDWCGWLPRVSRPVGMTVATVVGVLIMVGVVTLLDRLAERLTKARS